MLLTVHDADKQMKGGGATIAIGLNPETRGMWGQEMGDAIVAAPQVISLFKEGPDAYARAYKLGVQVTHNTSTHMVGARQFTYGKITFQAKALAAAVIKVMQASTQAHATHPTNTTHTCTTRTACCAPKGNARHTHAQPARGAPSCASHVQHNHHTHIHYNV